MCRYCVFVFINNSCCQSLQNNYLLILSNNYYPTLYKFKVVNNKHPKDLISLQQGWVKR